MNLQEGRESFIQIMVPIVVSFLVTGIVVLGVIIYVTGCRFVC